MIFGKKIFIFYFSRIILQELIIASLLIIKANINHFSAISHRDIILLCSRIHFKWISLCYCAPLGAKTILSQSHFVRRLLPLYFLIRFLDPDQPYFCTIQACHFDMNKLLRNLTPFRQHLLLL